jgi:hypothetical protein
MTRSVLPLPIRPHCAAKQFSVGPGWHRVDPESDTASVLADSVVGSRTSPGAIVGGLCNSRRLIQRFSAGNTMLIIDDQPIAPAPFVRPRAVPRVVQRSLVGGFHAGFPVLQICTGPRLS